MRRGTHSNAPRPHRNQKGEMQAWYRREASATSAVGSLRPPTVARPFPSAPGSGTIGGAPHRRGRYLRARERQARGTGFPRFHTGVWRQLTRAAPVARRVMFPTMLPVSATGPGSKGFTYSTLQTGNSRGPRLGNGTSFAFVLSRPASAGSRTGRAQPAVQTGETSTIKGRSSTP